MSEFQNPGQPKKSGCGKACAVGCATLFLLALASSGLLYLGGMKLVRRLTAEYTSTSPCSLPSVEVSQQEAADLLARADAFSQAVKAGQPSQKLTLSSRDINVLIQKNPAWSALAGKVYVTLDGDRIQGEASFPLEGLGKSFKGRWLNGTGTFRIETAAGRLLIFMDSLSVRGKPLPDSFMAGIRGKNLAEDATKKPEAAALLEKLDSITVRDGALHIVSK